MDLRQTPEAAEDHARFAGERARLLMALGALTEGGVLEAAEHVGATSMAGLVGRPSLDIALAVWPFPREDPPHAALENLCDTLDPASAGEPEQRFLDASGDTRLYVVASGSSQWTDYRLVREHLRHDAAARETYSVHKREWSVGGSETDYEEAKRRWLDRLVEEARRSWIEREGFDPARRVVDELRELPIGWRIAGGWALDLFLRRVTRVHHDVDIVVSRADQLHLRAYLTGRGWKLVTPYEQRFSSWPEHMRLEAPRFQVHAHRDGAFMDFMLTDMEGGVWRYRREPSIVRDLSQMELRTDEGIPFLAPELALLFKSKTSDGQTREKDVADFEGIYPRLEPERRAWLLWALTAYAPDHHWIARLRDVQK